MRFAITIGIFLLSIVSCQEIKQDDSDQVKSIDDYISKAQRNQIAKIDSALFYAQRAHRLAEMSDYSQGVAISAAILGEVCFLKGEFNLANEYLIRSLNELDRSESPTILGKVYNLLGRVYQYSEQHDLALEYYRFGLQTFKEIEYSHGLAESYGNIGHLHEKSRRYDSAIFYQNKARELFTLLGDSSGLAHIYDNIGSIYEDLEEYDKARTNFQNAYRINQKLNNEVEALINYNNLGDIHRKTNFFNEALIISRTVLQKAKALNQPYQISSAYRDISKIYKSIGSFSLAYAYLDSCYEKNSEIYSLEIANEIAETRAIYEVEQKEQQIVLLEKDKKISQVSRIALGGASILLFGIGGLVYLQLRTRIRKNKKIYSAERDLAQANEDRLTTELNFKRLQEEKLHQELETKSRELTTNALHIIQKNEFLENLKAQLKELKKTDDEKLNKKLKKIIKSIDYNFNLDDDWQEFETIFQQVHAEFFEQLRVSYPDLTSAEIRLCAMLRLNLNSKDIATIMGISQDSLRISRYRLRKKLGIDKGGNLYSFIMNIG